MRPFSTLLLAALGLPAFAQAPKWAPYAAKADGFSVLMPTTPRIVPQSAGGVTTRIYMAQTPSVVMVASKSGLPANFGSANLAAMRKAMRDSMLATSGSTATGERPATFGGLKGTQIDFKTANGGSGAMWMASAPRAFYSLTVASPKPMAASEVRRLFGSFKVK